MFTKHNKEGWEASGKILRSSNIDTLYGTLFAYSIYTTVSFKKIIKKIKNENKIAYIRTGLPHLVRYYYYFKNIIYINSS